MISRQGTLAALIAAVGNLMHGGPQKAHLKWSLSSVLDLAGGFSGDGAVNMPTCQHQFSSHIMKEHQITSSIRDLLRFTNHKKKRKLTFHQQTLVEITPVLDGQKCSVEGRYATSLERNTS